MSGTTNKNDFVGAVVKSTAGRDRKRVFLVVGAEGNAQDMRLLIADGRLHTVSSPKKKNPSHILVIGSVSDDETERIEELSDEDVEKLVKRYDDGGCR